MPSSFSRASSPGKGTSTTWTSLHGSIALARGDWQAAIGRFRAMLARDPNLPRVRLDLALAFFRAGQDTSAAYHFARRSGTKTCRLLPAPGRLPFSTHPPPQDVVDQCRVRACPRQQHQRRDERPAYRAVRPAGPALGGCAGNQRVGVTADISGGYEMHISPDLRFRTGAGLYTRTYRESQFNDRTLILRAGPEAALR